MNYRLISALLFLFPVLLANKEEYNASVDRMLAEEIAPTEIPLTSNSTERSIIISPFVNGFLSSLSVILVSELGDKTWFIAVVMAMRHSRLVVYGGAMMALALMTILSVSIGWLTQLIPRVYTYYASTALMFIFGLKMLYDGYKMSPNEGQEEFDEVEKEVNEREQTESDKLLTVAGQMDAPPPPPAWKSVLKIFVETFVLTFLAEWGDRSQMTTVLLAAREDVFGVALGGIVGHAACTGVAVLGGKLVADHISVRMVTLFGGVVFLLFAAAALIFNDSASETPPAGN
ncbi:hypothetical protein PFISCL1PPCAC_13581 [Pristionchus fissidentatus]|uniref:GDT1 family protein n=1 Tax=Pristionchus fissidentatus TaxID=1538716 RepID=A0AAV5VX35_9BILA|nr:hypothetical protein PFISCL1PPCAC_13581 [Pristionchus fissidentatus]